MSPLEKLAAEIISDIKASPLAGRFGHITALYAGAAGKGGQVAMVNRPRSLPYERGGLELNEILFCFKGTESEHCFSLCVDKIAEQSELLKSEVFKYSLSMEWEEDIGILQLATQIAAKRSLPIVGEPISR